MESNEKYDDLTFPRCPTLGGPVSFKYCRSSNGGLFCPNIIRCWIGKINDIVTFLKLNFTEEDIAKVLNLKE